MVKTRGQPIGALAVICVDNPMVAATGHRICNDCMKACIYQKQAPVDIPQAETRTLKDVLELPWGFEIYSLLTRWNPLNLRRPLPLRRQRAQGAGGGPRARRLHAGAPPDERRPRGGRHRRPQARAAGPGFLLPIKNIQDIREPLGERVMAGFGGVAEYGITVRWDKNFLKIIRLLLERRGQFAMFGGVRFGGTVTLEDAMAMGFDHVALCVGAGKPTVLDIPNGLARGVRAASDFLMALQLTGAAKEDSIANMQLRLPVVVIGGGLTADRHRHRIPRLLRRAGAQVPRALRGAGRRHRRRRDSPGLGRPGTRDRGRVSRAREDPESDGEGESTSNCCATGAASPSPTGGAWSTAPPTR